jgi:hypothetical protein
VGAGLGRVAPDQREQSLALEGIQDGAELRVERHVVSDPLAACGNTKILSGSVTMPPLLLARLTALFRATRLAGRNSRVAISRLDSPSPASRAMSGGFRSCRQD